MSPNTAANPYDSQSFWYGGDGERAKFRERLAHAVFEEILQQARVGRPDIHEPPGTDSGCVFAIAHKVGRVGRLVWVSVGEDSIFIQHDLDSRPHLKIPLHDPNSFDRAVRAIHELLPEVKRHRDVINCE